MKRSIAAIAKTAKREEAKVVKQMDSATLDSFVKIGRAHV